MARERQRLAGPVSEISRGYLTPCYRGPSLRSEPAPHYMRGQCPRWCVAEKGTPLAPHRGYRIGVRQDDGGCGCRARPALHRGYRIGVRQDDGVVWAHGVISHASFRVPLCHCYENSPPGRSNPTPSCRGSPVPTVGCGSGYALPVRLPTDKKPPTFITSCGLNKAIVILERSEEPPGVTRTAPMPLGPRPFASARQLA